MDTSDHCCGRLGYCWIQNITGITIALITYNYTCILSILYLQVVMNTRIMIPAIWLYSNGCYQNKSIITVGSILLASASADSIDYMEIMHRISIIKADNIHMGHLATAYKLSLMSRMDEIIFI